AYVFERCHEFRHVIFRSIVRGAVLSAKQNRYVEAAQAMGCRHPRIIMTHILPNVTAPILVIASIWLGNAILIEATLSFLGVGTQIGRASMMGIVCGSAIT